MFLKRLFAKPYQFYRDRGDRLLAQERFAEARSSFLEALERVSESADHEREETYLREALKLTGSSLAKLNLTEAEAAIRQADLVKAHDHLTLALELAEDVALREKTEKLMKELAEPDEKPVQSVAPRESHSCTGCGHDRSSDSNKSAPAEAQLPLGEQYQLLIHTLPGDLPARYALMGEEFAYAYMTSHLGEHSRALEIYEQLLPGSDNDILHYETAITKFQLGDVNGCEEFLLKAVGLNGFNPLCNLSMAQLYCRTGRYEEAIARLQLMLASNILSEQAMMLLGDVYELQGNEDSAVQIYSQALNAPALKRAAAERLLPIFERQGRAEDVQYLQRHYLKGCC